MKKKEEQVSLFIKLKVVKMHNNFNRYKKQKKKKEEKMERKQENKPSLPCREVGDSCDKFSKYFLEEIQENVLGYPLYKRRHGQSKSNGRNKELDIIISEVVAEIVCQTADSRVVSVSTQNKIPQSAWSTFPCV